MRETGGTCAESFAGALSGGVTERWSFVFPILHHSSNPSLPPPSARRSQDGLRALAAGLQQLLPGDLQRRLPLRHKGQRVIADLRHDLLLLGRDRALMHAAPEVAQITLLDVLQQREPQNQQRLRVGAIQWRISAHHAAAPPAVTPAARHLRHRASRSIASPSSPSPASGARAHLTAVLAQILQPRVRRRRAHKAHQRPVARVRRQLLPSPQPLDHQTLHLVRIRIGSAHTAQSLRDGGHKLRVKPTPGDASSPASRSCANSKSAA
jgi:hypothetical protein